MKDPDPLNLRPDDPMVKWRRDAIRDGEARRAAERERQRCEELDAVAGLRAEMREEIANLRAEVYRLHEVAIEATGEGIGVYADKVIDRAEAMIREIRDLLTVAIERRFGELMGRMDALASGASPRSKGFKFANEDDNVADLPNPLRKGMN
jgi:hypothetical protein